MAATEFADDFTGSGNLGGSDVGADTGTQWEALKGSWTRQGGKAVTLEPARDNPMVVADLGFPVVDMRIDTATGFNGGDSLYFRVSDVNNWWRLCQRSERSTGSYTANYYETTGPWILNSRTLYPKATQSAGLGVYYSGTGFRDSHGNPVLNRKTTILEADASNYWVYKYSIAVRQPTVNYENDYYYLALEKSVAGAVEQVKQVSVGNNFGSLRVSASAENIIFYHPTAATALATVVDSFNDDANRHGFGLSSGNFQEDSSLDNWSATIPASAGPPRMIQPEDGTDKNVAEPITVVMQSGSSPSNLQTDGDVRWRRQGDTSWTVEPGVFGTGQTWAWDASGLTTPVQIEMQAQWTDSFTNVSGWGGSAFFWVRAVPESPVFVSPAEDSLVVATTIAVVDFDNDSVPATAKEARRVGDHEGNPENDRIFETGLTLTPVLTPATLPEVDAYYLAQIAAVAGEPAGILTEPGSMTLSGFTAMGNRSLYTVYDAIGASSSYDTIASLNDGAATNGSIRFALGTGGGGTSWVARFDTKNGSSNLISSAADLGLPGRIAATAWVSGGMTARNYQVSGLPAFTGPLTAGNGMSTSPVLNLGAAVAGVDEPLITLAYPASHDEPTRNQLMPLMKAWADARDSLTLPARFRLSGDAGVHPEGTEHIQVRRQTSDGGSLWSGWRDLRVEMQQASPFPPEVVYTPITEIGAVRVRAEFTEPDLNHVEATQLWIFRDGIRIAVLAVEASEPVAFEDREAKAEANYQVAAVGDNGTIAYTVEPSTVATPDDGSPVVDNGTPSNPRGKVIV